MSAIEDGQKITRLLPCKLNEAEFVERGEEMAKCELAEEKLKAERRMVNGQIKVQVQERARLGHIIDKGEEDREVDCKWISNFATNEWLLIRQDNGAQVEARTMTASDLQGKLGFDDSETTVGEIVDEDPFGIEADDTQPPAPPTNSKGGKARSTKKAPAKKAPAKKKASKARGRR